MVIEDVSSQDQYRAAMPVIYKISGRSEDFKHQIDGYLTDAERMVKIWLSAEG